MEPFYNDPTFWFGVSFVIFVGVVWVYARKAIGAALDSYGVKIRTDLDQAAALQAEAAALLKAAHEKETAAAAEAQTLLTKAKEQAELIRTNAEKELANTLKIREAQALDRIHLLEEQAKQELRAQLADLSIRAASIVLQGAVGSAQDEMLIAQQMTEMAARLGKVA